MVNIRHQSLHFYSSNFSITVQVNGVKKLLYLILCCLRLVFVSETIVHESADLMEFECTVFIKIVALEGILHKFFRCLFGQRLHKINNRKELKTASRWNILFVRFDWLSQALHLLEFHYELPRLLDFLLQPRNRVVSHLLFLNRTHILRSPGLRRTLLVSRLHLGLLSQVFECRLAD